MAFRYKLRVPAAGGLRFPDASATDLQHLAARAESVQAAAKDEGAAGENVDEAIVAFQGAGWRAYVREELRIALSGRQRVSSW